MCAQDVKGTIQGLGGHREGKLSETQDTVQDTLFTWKAKAGDTL